MLLAFLLLPLVVSAASVRVYHNDTTRVEYFPRVCKGVGCGSNCDAWWVTGGPCWNNGEATHSCMTPQASLRFNFTGTSITWHAVSYDLGARAVISLDGTQVAVVSTLASTVTFDNLIWSRSDLQYAPHVLTIAYEQSTFNASNQRYIQVYAFDYTEPSGTTTSAGQPSDTTGPNSTNNTVAIAAGSSVGAVAAILIIGLVTFFLYRRKKPPVLPTAGGYNMPYTPTPSNYYPNPAAPGGGGNFEAEQGRQPRPDYVPTPYVLPPAASASGRSHSPSSAYARDAWVGDTADRTQGFTKRPQAQSSPLMSGASTPSAVGSSLPAMTSSTTLTGSVAHPQPHPLSLAIGAQQMQERDHSSRILSPASTILPAYSEVGDRGNGGARGRAPPLPPIRAEEHDRGGWQLG